MAKLENLINKDLLEAYDNELKKTYLAGGAVFDISAHKATGSPATPATFASLTAALGTNGANIPQNMRKGGMAVKFIKGSSQSQSNKYVQYRLTTQTFSTSEADWECIEDSVSALEQIVGTGGSVDERIAAEGARHYLKAETYTKTEVNGLVDTPHQEYVTVEHYADLPATGSADTIYRVSNWDGSANSGQGAVDATVYSEYAWDDVSSPNKYVFLCVKSLIGEVFDISVYNNNAVYADLAAALGTNGANVPESLRKGGMSVKFIQGSVQSSDNKYVQYRLTAYDWSTDVADWKNYDVDPGITYDTVLSANIHNNATPAAASDPEPTDGRDWAEHNVDIAGRTTTSNGYTVSYYIPIIGGESYKCTKVLRRLVWFDSNKKKVGGSIEKPAANTELIAPETAVFCKFMYANSNNTPDDVRFGKYNDDIDVEYSYITEINDKNGRKILTEDDYKKLDDKINAKTNVTKTLTAVGSSGLALGCGGQYQLTQEQKTAYGVSTDLVMAKVVQVLLGYDEVNVCAFGGHTASNTVFKCGLTGYVLKNSVTLPANGNTVSYVWNTTNIGALMTENLSSVSASYIGTFDGIVNGVDVVVNSTAGTIALKNSRSSDFVIPANSIITRPPLTGSFNSNGVLRKSVVDSYGIIIQVGANTEGATPEEILAYNELLIKASNCKWFVCLPKNATGINGDPANDLNAAVTLLKKNYGARFIDHRPYMCSLEALSDQGITPTTSEIYPDANGQNSNPLTATQIANGVKCDMQCVAEGLYPSSFWHSAYRDGEEQTINDSHFNAQGLECWGKYVVRMIKQMGY